MKSYNVKFTEKKKYFPSTRTVEVLAEDSAHAERLVHNRFGSLKMDSKLPVYMPTDKIKINEIEEIVGECV